MSKASKFLIYFLACYIPYEGFILKLLGVTGLSLAISKQLPDLLILLAVSVAFMASIDRSFRISKPLALFIFGLVGLFLTFWIVGLLQGVVTDSVLVSILQIKAMSRYVLVSLLLILIVAGTQSARLLVRLISVAGAIQLAVIFLQVLNPDVYGPLFLPTVIDIQVIEGLNDHSTALFEYQQSQHVSGTFRHNIGAAFFLLVVLACVLSECGGGSGRRASLYDFFKFRWVYAAFILVGLYWVGSRIALIVGCLILLRQIAVLGRISILNLTLSVTTIIVTTISLLSINLESDDRTSFFYIFSDRYIEIAEKQRLGLIYTAYDTVAEYPKTALLGLGFSHDAIHQFVWNSDVYKPSLLYWNAESVEDVYWIALFFYFGGAGLLVIIAFLIIVGIKLYRARMLPAGEIGFLLYNSMILLAFFNQSFEVRSLSFYVWCFVGLAATEMRLMSNANSYGGS